jgi:hypothetical protein
LSLSWPSLRQSSPMRAASASLRTCIGVARRYQQVSCQVFLAAQLVWIVVLCGFSRCVMALSSHHWLHFFCASSSRTCISISAEIESSKSRHVMKKWNQQQ